MAMADVEQLAQGCKSLDELARTLDEFDACPLKRTATQLCFCRRFARRARDDHR